MAESGRVARAAATTAAATGLLGQLFFDLLRHGVEGHIDVLGLLGARLKEGHGELGGELLALLEGYLAPIFHVAFVADEDLADTSLRVLLDFVDPGAHVVEGLAVRHVVHDDDTLGTYLKNASFVIDMLSCPFPEAGTPKSTIPHFPKIESCRQIRVSGCHAFPVLPCSLTSVVACREGAEPFLAGRVPNLQLDHIVFMLHCLKFEVDANGVEKVLVEGVLGVAQQQA